MRKSCFPPVIFDEYHLLRPLGRGRCGSVHLARDKRHERLVAIKFFTCEDDRRKRFLVEVSAIARLQHPNVVCVYRVGELESRPYLVEEYIPGICLHRISTPLPGPQVVALGLDIARGLAAAHRSGVLHRDVKPANIILADDGLAKMLDFSHAELLSTADRETVDIGLQLTACGRHAADATIDAGRSDFTGTPYYTAPEVWAGQKATPASDVYSLGVLLHELFAGHVPHHNIRRSQLRRIVCERDAPPLTGIASDGDKRLADVIARCLARASRNRYPTALHLRDALQELWNRV